MNFNKLDKSSNDSSISLASQVGCIDSPEYETFSEQQVELKQTFLVKLYDMVEEVETNDIVNWLPEGNGFQITNVDVFCSQILPKYYDHNKFTSFIRQLNMYDFCKQRGCQ